MLIAASTGKSPLIRETEQFPAIISGTRGEGEGGRKRTTGQKSYREMDSSAMHSQFKSSIVWQGQRHEHEMVPGQRAGNPVQIEVFAL